ncbi:alpha/beta fold hydrolase [Aquibium sp. ELW1220]|uniref:alpha/beta hydrolase n=1 Tax=Aquibium sp. ELW1220 TaxID=2976766 RepID=UPI0025B1393A|nr:alpha/beta fold hydrolase [Aquibium sp. ELW1220]MDN2578997.1 alpha/beta hydrolase [Aquibium sp. ELW1220]
MITRTQHEIAIRFGSVVGTMKVRVWSPSDDAPVLFCLPGFIGHIGSEYCFIADHLARNGYKVVVPDLIGRGESTYFGRKEVYSPRNIMYALHAVISAFPGRSRFLMGTSWGGIMSIMYVQAFRERFQGLVLNDIPVTNGGTNIEFRDHLIAMCNAEFDSLDEAARWGHDLLDNTLGPLPANLDSRFFGEHYVRKAGSRFRYKIDPVIAEVIRDNVATRFDLTDSILGMNCPVAMLYGIDSWHRDAANIASFRKGGPDITIFDSLVGKHPPLLATRDQHMIVQGFLDYAGNKAKIGVS